MPSISTIFNRKKKLNKDGKAAIEFQIIINRKASFISSKLYIFPVHWDSKKRQVNNRFPLYLKYNDFLHKKVSEVNKYFDECVMDNQTPTIDDVKLIVSGEKKDYNDFIKFSLAEVELRTDITNSTKSSHRSKLKKLVDCFTSLSWRELHLNKVQELDRFLADQGLSVNSRWVVHKVVKTYLNIAIKKGFIESSPYDHFKAKREKPKKTAITDNELQELIKHLDKKNNQDIKLTLKKYIFSCFTGLRISDIQSITDDNFKVTDNEIYLTVEQQKSRTIIRDFPLLKVAKIMDGKEVVQKIFNEFYGSGETFFPIQEEPTINRQLKTWMNQSGTKTHLTFHTARHTFGTRLAEITGDVLLIKELMGHSKIETSMEYIHLTSKRIENKLDKFL